MTVLLLLAGFVCYYVIPDKHVRLIPKEDEDNTLTVIQWIGVGFFFLGVLNKIAVMVMGLPRDSMPFL